MADDTTQGNDKHKELVEQIKAASKDLPAPDKPLEGFASFPEGDAPNIHPHDLGMLKMNADEALDATKRNYAEPLEGFARFPEGDVPAMTAETDTFLRAGKEASTERAQMDEAYMQDAIAAAKATGALHELNPQDAPAPVQQGGFAAQVGRRETPSIPDAKLNAEDKAFSELEKQLARREKGEGQGQGRG